MATWRTKRRIWPSLGTCSRPSNSIPYSRYAIIIILYEVDNYYDMHQKKKKNSPHVKILPKVCVCVYVFFFITA